MHEEEHLAIRLTEVAQTVRNVTRLSGQNILDMMRPVKFTMEHVATREPIDFYRYIPQGMDGVVVWTMSNGISYLVMI